MKLIADSGSTKTAWRSIASDGSIGQINTVGFNPFFTDTESIIAELQKSLVPNITETITEIHYYGTGCSTPQNQEIVRKALCSVFSKANLVEVNTDMLGAARGLCGHQAGIACILGTGSNTCYYDGSQIAHQVNNLGFWLGDEGSGGYLGKILLSQFLLNELPTDLAARFSKRHPHITRNEVLESAYKKPNPNRYFAGFSKFWFDNRHHPHAHQVLYDAFTLFLKRYVCKYENHQTLRIHFTGSVAFYYSDLLRQTANDLGLTIGIIAENPIAGLALYHQ